MWWIKRWFVAPLGALGLAGFGVVGGPGCDSDKGTEASSAEEVAESAPDLSGLQLDDPAGAADGLAEAGLAVGDASVFYSTANKIRAELNYPIARLANLVGDIAQKVHATGECGKGFCTFSKDKDGITYTLKVLQLPASKAWFKLSAKKDQVSRVVAYGNFLKKEPRKGVAWIVLRFTKLGEVDATFKAKGTIVAQFNNMSAVKKIRLLAKDVDRNGDGEVINAGFGFRRDKSTGAGRFRFAVQGELSDQITGKELLAGRARWNGAKLGRGDAILIDPSNDKGVGSYHECWDAAHLIVWFSKRAGIGAGSTEVETAGDSTLCGKATPTATADATLAEEDELPTPDESETWDDDPETEIEDLDDVPDPGDTPPEGE